MTNEEILNSRWKSVDKYLKNYLKHYKEINFKTRDSLQTIFDSIDVPYNDLNKTVPSHIKNRLNRYIDELKENNLLQGYFGYTAKLLRNRKSINYGEYLEFMILSVYIKEYYEIKDYNTDSFYRICENAYNQGIKDIRRIKTVKSETFNMSIFYTLMNLPLLETTAENYLYSISLTNANDMYKQTLINLQLEKGLNVDNHFFRDVFQKQMNRYINFNGDKLSGAIVNISENLVNKSYLQAGLDNDVEQCRFISEIDNRTTKMCESLDNQLFYLNKMNIYQRYSEADKKYVTYHTNGLALGENLPPINNHFHWCRSTITYLIDKSFEDIYNITNKEAFFEKINMKDVDKKLEEYEKSIRHSDKENMIVICPDGIVYRFIGDTDSVTLKDVDLTGAIITHNHPIEETCFSFEGDDRRFWNSHPELNVLRGTDEIYTYQFSRIDLNIDHTILYDNIFDMPFEESQHIQNIEKAKEFHYGYTRRQISVK